jgi:hypothetical protein
MAVIIGGTENFSGKNNRLTDTKDNDVVFGDPYTTGAEAYYDVFGNLIDIPQIGRALSSGRGGNDRMTAVAASTRSMAMPGR